MKVKTKNKWYRRKEKTERRKRERTMEEAMDEAQGKVRFWFLIVIVTALLLSFAPIVTARAEEEVVLNETMEYSFVLSALLLWVPTGFFIATSILGLLAEVGAKRMFGFYALMLAGAVSGIAVGETMSFFASPVTSVGAGCIVGGIVGGAMGAFSCGLLTKEKRTVGGHVFLLGLAAAGIIGAASGAFAGIQNHRMLFAYLTFILAIELLSFIVAQCVRIIRNLIGTFRFIAGW